MADGLRNEKSSHSREAVFGRQILRATLGIIFAGVTLVFVLQGVSVKNATQWLIYLGMFVATDLIANAVLNRIARQEEQGNHSTAGPSSRLSH